MKRSARQPSRAALAAICLFLLGAFPAFSDRLWTTFALEYGTASSTFGLSAPPFFVVSPQYNSSADVIISASVEYGLFRRGPFELGLAAKGSFGLSSWNLGAPGVTDSQSNYYPYDQIHVAADWWALAAMGTMHFHLRRFLTWDAAIGYGPYGYRSASYYDDDGVVSGPISGSSSIFPPNTWSIEWSTGFSLVYWGRVGFLVSVGSTGPDFVTGLGVKIAL